jgi:PBP1b-binding outer membrane lipoprotein LpoB
VVAVLVIVGCATSRHVSREEYTDMTTRTYEGVTKEQVSHAAENFFTLLDGDDFDITHSGNTVKGIRIFMFLLVGGG